MNLSNVSMSRRDFMKSQAGVIAAMMAVSTGLGLTVLPTRARAATTVGSTIYANGPYPLTASEFAAEDTLSASEVAGKVAIVTGASSGIGKSTAEKLVAEGFTVVGTSRNPSAYPTPVGYELWKLDLSRPLSVAIFAARVKARFSVVHLLVLNAGKFFLGRADEPDLRAVRKLMETNYVGNVSLLKKLKSRISDSDYARIMITSSISNDVYSANTLTDFGIPGLTRNGESFSPYAISRAAMHRLGHSLQDLVTNVPTGLTPGVNPNLGVSILHPTFLGTRLYEADRVILGTDINDPLIQTNLAVFAGLAAVSLPGSEAGESYRQLALLRTPVLNAYMADRNPPAGSPRELLQLINDVAYREREDRTIRADRS